ncbi:circadian clock KaiB family protein [uncultured Brevundimonas sp.]|uniref:circadian clock KaiB family protein n=1 Tax=uncultured Brevundimonas sp. TaxID=213418 RepID=UPI0030EC08F0|tara:strand:+ start:4182 stop:4505 length:324 start_codon:yes stop_codon:yes gene_type:complete
MMPASQPPPVFEYALRLYVTGTTTRSAKAIANLRQVCESRLEGRYELEVIDIYQEPGAAADHQILAAPTLVKMSPLPMRRIIGDLSDHSRLLAGLGLEALPEIGGEH